MSDDDKSGIESAVDQAKGWVKEAAGDLTGDEGLQEQGQREQERGELKEEAAEKQEQADEAQREADATAEAAERREG